MGSYGSAVFNCYEAFCMYTNSENWIHFDSSITASDASITEDSVTGEHVKSALDELKSAIDSQVIGVTGYFGRTGKIYAFDKAPKEPTEFSPGIRLQWYLEYSTNEYLDRYGDLNHGQAQAVLCELMDCR